MNKGYKTFKIPEYINKIDRQERECSENLRNKKNEERKAKIKFFKTLIGKAFILHFYGGIPQAYYYVYDIDEKRDLKEGCLFNKFDSNYYEPELLTIRFSCLARDSEPISFTPMFIGDVELEFHKEISMYEFLYAIENLLDKHKDDNLVRLFNAIRRIQEVN